MKKKELLSLLGLPDPYVGFVPFRDTLAGWNGGEFVTRPFIIANRPKLIIEVGAWLGLSTILMAHALAQEKIDDCVILTIDTWLGSLEHWQKGYADENLHFEHGFPTLYPRFLSNVVQRGFQSSIVPLPLPSQIAARWLATLPLRADLIYLDGSHDEKDVYEDLCAYGDLLACDGAIMGDDFQWPSVEKSVKRFCEEKRMSYTLTPDAQTVYWSVQKPL